MLKVSGYWLITISIIHGLNNISYYFEPWSDVVRNGIFNAVDPYLDRGTAFWMFMFSPLIFALGQLCCWAQDNNVRLPAFIGWNLLITSAFGAFLMPISGFWLLIPPSILMIISSYSRIRFITNDITEERKVGTAHPTTELNTDVKGKLF